MRGPAGRTLRGRVALVGSGVLGICVVLLTVGVNVVLGSRLDAQADHVLRTRAEAAAATVEFSSTGSITVHDSANDAAIDVGTWIFHGTVVVEAPAGGKTLAAEAASLVGRGRLFSTTNRSSGVRWYAEPLPSSENQLATVVTSESLSPYQTTKQLTLVGTIILGLLFLGAAYLALRTSIGLALGPVDAMTRQAAQWSAHDVERRFGDQSRPRELEDLATTLDGLLNRVSGVLRHERQLSMEISHELRTPLARLSAEVQLLARDRDLSPSQQDTLSGLSANIDEMSQILETLMSQARQGSSSANGRCDAATIVSLLASRRDPAPRVRVRSDDTTVGVDAAVLERALGPVVDNAVRFASSWVEIEISSQRGSVAIAVSDDGPGIASCDLPGIFEPGRRGTVPDQHAGAGLGLALAKRLVEAANGSLSAANSADGAVFVLTLPAG